MAKRGRVWKIRVVKPYAEAHNHVIIGDVLEETPTWIRVRGRTYHFGKTVQRIQDIKVGAKSVRIIPWSRVEVIHELPGSFEWDRGALVADGKGNIALKQGDSVCPIVSEWKVAK